jgi:hypothetical protein
MRTPQPAFAVEGPAGNVIGRAQNLRRLGIESPVPKKWYDRGHERPFLQRRPTPPPSCGAMPRDDFECTASAVFHQYIARQKCLSSSANGVLIPRQRSVYWKHTVSADDEARAYARRRTHHGVNAFAATVPHRGSPRLREGPRIFGLWTTSGRALLAADGVSARTGKLALHSTDSDARRRRGIFHECP